MGARLAIAVLVVALGILSFAAPYRPAPASCPDATHSDPSRLARVVRLLAGQREGTELLRRVGGAPPACFARIDEGVLRSDGVVVLSDSRTDAAAAARLGHLLVHQLDGFAFDDGAGGRPCSMRVAAAIVAEARGHAQELRLRRQLGVPEPLLPADVERAYWAAQAFGDEAGVEALRVQLARAGPGSLAEAYARRCRD